MTYEERLANVKAMDKEVNNFNDEDLIMTWFMVGCPDCSSEEDYEWFAEDEYEYAELVRLFEKLKKLENEG